MPELKIGQTVEWNGRTMVLLDRAPGADSWWLQDAETGEVNHRWYARDAHLTLIADQYRDMPDVATLAGGAQVIVKHRSGEWCVIRGNKPHGWEIWHAPSGRRLALRKESSIYHRENRGPVKLEDAKRVANGLAQRFPTMDADNPEQVRQVVELVASWQECGVAA